MSDFELIRASQYLAENGAELKIIQSLADVHQRYLRSHFKKFQGTKNRRGTHWLRGSYAFMADRIYRLTINLFSESAIERHWTVFDLETLHRTYRVKFPSDQDVDVTRIYYLIQDIRCGDAVILKACECCGLPSVTHRFDILEKKCHVCKL